MIDQPYSELEWPLCGKKIDIGGPDGNVFFLIGKVSGAIRSVYGNDDAEAYSEGAHGRTFKAMGFTDWTYEDVLKYTIDSTGIELTADRDIGINEILYTITRNDYL